MLDRLVSTHPKFRLSFTDRVLFEATATLIIGKTLIIYTNIGIINHQQGLQDKYQILPVFLELFKVLGLIIIIIVVKHVNIFCVK